MFQPKRVKYLDGIRAIAALFVVATHAMTELNLCDAPLATHHAHWFNFGFAAVCVFIVLSGYCLTLPLVQQGDPSLSLNVTRFIRNRFRRILPPYYAAFIVSLTVILFKPTHVPESFFWTNGTTALHPDVLASHLFLIHNLSKAWAQKVDFPLWSIATEWQIYFLFPLLLWSYRKIGAIAPVSVAFLLGLAAMMALAPINGGTDTASPYLLGLFAMGMMTCIYRGDAGDKVSQWVGAAAISFLAFLTLSFRATDWAWNHQMIQGILVGVIACCLLLFLGRRKSILRDILEWKPLVLVGSFSYSLYLIHVPVLALVHVALARVGAASVFSLFLIGMPVVLGSSYLFHLAFERPFMTKSVKKVEIPTETTTAGAIE